VIVRTRSLRSTLVATESEDHIMRPKIITAARRRLVPLAALLFATALGGCVAYTGYPAASYAYPNSYYGGYPASYSTYSYNYPRYYWPDYNGTFDTYRNGGSGN
jgi:hypothetical protein